MIRTKIEATAASVFGRVKHQLSKVASTEGNSNEVVTEFRFPSREEYDKCYCLVDVGEIDKNIDQGMEYLNLRALSKWQPRPGFDVDAFLAGVGAERFSDDELALRISGTDEKPRGSEVDTMGSGAEI